MSRIVHFEIPASDPDKSLRFYKKVFGWEFSQWGEEAYWLAKTGKEDTPGINGAIIKRKDPQQPVTNTIEVKDIDAVITTITAEGCEIVVPKMAIPTVGWLIYFKDPDQMILGVLQPDQHAK